jgi:hypothetical protein
MVQYSGTSRTSPVFAHNLYVQPQFHHPLPICLSTTSLLLAVTHVRGIVPATDAQQRHIIFQLLKSQSTWHPDCHNSLSTYRFSLFTPLLFPLAGSNL